MTTTLSPTQQVVDRDIRARQEFRRGTVLTPILAKTFDTSGVNSTVFVVDVDIGTSRPVRDVIVKSTSGKGGRAYAEVGKAVDIQRNQGGRWFCVGASDRTRSIGQVQEFNESTETFGAQVAEGFTTTIRPYDFFAINLTYGSTGWGGAIIVDSAGNEVVT